MKNYTQNWNASLDTPGYNFLYIPFDGYRYYPNNGSYRTVFRITLNNDKTDIITFDATVAEIDSNENPILDVVSDVFNFGENIEFTGTMYAKYREPLLLPDETLNSNHGKVVFPNTQQRFVDLYNGNVIDDVLLTVFDITTAQRLISKESLGNDIITVAPAAYELNYTFPTTRLPMGGLYRFRFEIEAQRDIVGTNANNILCVFDIDVSII